MSPFSSVQMAVCLRRSQPFIPVMALLLCLVLRMEQFTVWKLLGIATAVPGAVLGQLDRVCSER